MASADRLTTKENASLNVMRRFVTNCMERKRYDAALGEEWNAMSLKGGKSKLGTVAIPEPGVPDEGIDLEGEVLADRVSEMPWEDREGVSHRIRLIAFISTPTDPPSSLYMTVYDSAVQHLLLRHAHLAFHLHY